MATAAQEPPDNLALSQAATFSEGDLDYIMDSVATAAGERVRLARAIREDSEIRAAMLADDRLFQALLSHDEAFVNVSSYLFFTVLLLRARRDLQAQGYTREREGDFTMPVFDSDEVCACLGVGATLGAFADNFPLAVKPLAPDRRTLPRLAERRSVRRLNHQRRCCSS